MTPVFADTYYYAALVNPMDAGHVRAKDYARTATRPLVTTGWILTELADGLAKINSRNIFSRLFGIITNDPTTTLLPVEQSLMDRGLALYLARPDKEWSLTDCISFVVMQEQNLAEALTADRHFEQAGFVALLK